MRVHGSDHESAGAADQGRSAQPRGARLPAFVGDLDAAHRPVTGLPPASIPALQRSMGNTAVTQMLQSRRREATEHEGRQQTGPGRRAAAPASGTPVVQRMATPAQKQFDAAGYGAAFLTIPAENFGEGGEAPAVPRTARVGAPRNGEIQLLRTPVDWAPPQATNRRAQPQTSIKARFRSSFFTYEVELVNDPEGAARGNPSLIDVEAPFEILSRTPRGSQGTSMGRTYAFGDRWAHNPAYWAAGGINGPAAQELAQSRGLDADAELRAGDVDFNDYHILPYTGGQPFLFYVPNDKADPKFRTEGRRFMEAHEFDALPGPQRSETKVSIPPQVDRRDGDRRTARTMQNTQAHEWMGQDLGGSRAVLAAYEWCHLIGDKDGGPDIPRNLVIGTNAVNTEQLALETALRPYVARLYSYRYGIQLRVEALMEKAPGQINPPAGLWDEKVPLKASWISYHISIVPLATPDTDQPVADVHRQIMDADRGTITESEFTSLHHEVRNKIRAKADAVIGDRPTAPGGPGGGGQT
ncbi:hypothetical protein STHAL_32340 [Streptomyces halstedii]|uniref:Uncharacterized protein n=1 Tax=Streptomyces halstedii TaxID=1944 RepID=A0ABS6U1M2_STRHA|nr:hypothetical protein [Streptomyces halstedii]MBV7674138.1 hypothetical protein [Streptomyces halstedii]